MIWVKKDFQGNKQVWYSGDIINKVKNMLLNITKQKMYDPEIDTILTLLETEGEEND